MNLKSMSLDRLANLRGQVEAALVAKVADQRRALESELSKISRFQVGGAKAKAGRGGQGSSIAPKYRNPENAAETWAGRGLKPRWLAAAIKSGKKQADFAIAGGFLVLFTQGAGSWSVDAWMKRRDPDRRLQFQESDT